MLKTLCLMHSEQAPLNVIDHCGSEQISDRYMKWRYTTQQQQSRNRGEAQKLQPRLGVELKIVQRLSGILQQVESHVDLLSRQRTLEYVCCRKNCRHVSRCACSSAYLRYRSDHSIIDENAPSLPATVYRRLGAAVSSVVVIDTTLALTSIVATQLGDSLVNTHRGDQTVLCPDCSC